MECAELPLHALLQLACGKKNIGYYFIFLLHILRIPIFYLHQVHSIVISCHFFPLRCACMKIDLVLEIDLVLLLDRYRYALECSFHISENTIHQIQSCTYIIIMIIVFILNLDYSKGSMVTLFSSYTNKPFHL